MAPVNLPSQLTMIKPRSASGLYIYKIKNKALSKYLFQETDERNIAFINDGGDNTKYYYKVTFDGDQATIVNSNGRSLARGSNSTYANATTQAVSPVSLTFCGGNDYFLFPNTHSTAQNSFTKNNATYNTDTNPYFLTTNTTTEAGNQYTFEEVTIPDGSSVYSVQFKGLEGLSVDNELTVTYTKEGYEGNATVGNGGFYVFSEAPTSTDFTVFKSDYTSSSVEVDAYNHVVKVVFTGNAANVTYKIKMNGVEYASQAVRVSSTFKSKSLLGDYYGFANGDAITMQVNEGEAVPVKNCFDENGTNKLASVNNDDVYTFALKTTDLLKGVEPGDMTTETGLEKGTLYQISSAITKVLTVGRGGKKIYGKPEMIYTKAIGDDLDSEPFLAMAHSLWKFVYTDKEQGYFKIYNQVTGKYMGPVANPVVFTDEAGAGVYKLIPATAVHHTNQTTGEMRENMSDQPLFKIAASDAGVGLGDTKKLHIQNTGSNQLIGYDQDEIWSKWYFTASHATPAKVYYVKSIESRLLLQERITPSTMVDMTNMTYSTNAQQKDGGDDATDVNSGCLKDNNSSTYFHSRYNDRGYADTETNPAVHWLQVDLGENNGLTSFSFHTKKRMGNNNNRPTEIEVQVSEDNSTFYYLYTLYSIPTTNDDFYSPSYPLGKAKDANGNVVTINNPRYLRFIVKATNTNTNYFTYSEFHIQTTKGVLPDDLAQASLKAGKAAIDAVCSPYNTEKDFYKNTSKALYEARDNAFAYESAYTSLKEKLNFVLKLGEDVHQYKVQEGSTMTEQLSAALKAIKDAGEVTANNTELNTTAKCVALNEMQWPAFTLNLPKEGEVYLLKSAVNGKYAATETKTVSNATTSSLYAMDADYANEKLFLLEYTSDHKLKSVIDNSELILKDKNTYTFSEHPLYPNTYLVESSDRYMYAGDDALNFNGINEAGYQARQTSWMLEHVKTYPVTAHEVSEGKNWATFYTNEAVYLPDGVKARYIDKSTANPTETETGSKVYRLEYTEIEDEKNVLPANTGVLLVAENSGEHKLYASRYVSSVETPEHNALVGMATANDPTIKKDGEVLYALGKPEGCDPGFYRYTGSTIPLNKAFLKMDFTTGTTAARGFIFVEGDDTTGIEEILPAAAGEDDGVYYDLTGKKVINPTRPGIYIKNGKKLVIK